MFYVTDPLKDLEHVESALVKYLRNLYLSKTDQEICILSLNIYCTSVVWITKKFT